MNENTPMMNQYTRIREKYPDAVLFFRLGDFYEMFNQDAREVSAILNITLTKRNGIPMCGIPYHAASGYIARLLNAGKKIAVCEQTALPKGGKGIAEREVVEIISPGTVIDDNFLEKNRNNYLMALGKTGSFFSLAYIDISTGEFRAAAFEHTNRLERIRRELLKLKPREIIVQESLLEDDREIEDIIKNRSSLLINSFPDWYFDYALAYRKLTGCFSVVNLKAFGLEEKNPELLAAGVLITYIEENSKKLLEHIRDIKVLRDDEYLYMDESSIKNLEIVQNIQDYTRKYSLIDVSDFTKTAAGARRFSSWLLHPLNRLNSILERQQKVDIFYRNQLMLSSVREKLGSMQDVERLVSRISMDKANPKDLVSLKNTVRNFLDLKESLEQGTSSVFFESFNSASEELIETQLIKLDAALNEEPSILLSEGNVIKEGYNNELDSLRSLKNNSKSILDQYLEEEKKLSGIQNLRIKYNQIIGYFFEVSKGAALSAPPYFIRRQSLVNCERYSTEKLIELETALVNAEDKILELERQLFSGLISDLKQHIKELLNCADIIADLDCFQNLAFAATVNAYTKPLITESRKLIIKNGRHPVVEKYLPAGEFICNDIEFDGDSNSFALITGPNMAGKSTVLRQTALIVLLAQIGAYVPAEEAEIGIVDRIFCRVGASDNISRGESTFLVEMNETANILRSATPDSLIIMDEIGRGTGTNDGLSIAWAVCEYLLDVLKSRTLFATHYHELTAIRHQRLFNLSMDAVESGKNIIFLKKIKKGPSDNSYGIHAARLAGLPETVTERAEELLKTIASGIKPVKDRKPVQQQKLFTEEELIIKKILQLNLDKTTPLEALNLLYSIKNNLSS
jgi:DNA mismatch repair protein MutS